MRFDGLHDTAECSCSSCRERRARKFERRTRVIVVTGVSDANQRKAIFAHLRKVHGLAE